VSSDHVRIRVKMGANEIEIEGPKDSIQGLLDLVAQASEQLAASAPAQPQMAHQAAVTPAQGPPASLPDLHIERGESLPSIITKLFGSGWGRTPRRLIDVKGALESYGMVYPRQSVAVALLRLAQDGKLRRFKGADGEFLYTLSTSLLSSAEGTPPQETEPHD